MPDKPQRAISIRQPYAEQILRGEKVFEYRSKLTHIRERVYIYASLKPGDARDFEAMAIERGALPTGVLVGTVDITGCQFLKRKDCYGYTLENPRRLRTKLKPVNQPQPLWFRPF